MHFGPLRNDQDRIVQSRSATSIFDSTPLPKPERLRERNKDKEIGPNLRFVPSLTVERIFETLNTRTGYCYTVNDKSAAKARM